MDLDPDVVISDSDRVSAVDAHPHLDLAAVRPAVGHQRALTVGRGSDRVDGLAEDHEEGVAGGRDLDAPMCRERRTQKTVVILQQADVGVTQMCEEPCAPLDVGEEDGEWSARQVAHAVSLWLPLSIHP